jgi:hypothetical protein
VLPAQTRGIGPDHHRVRDRDDLVHRELRPVGVIPDRFGAARLMDADGPDRALALLENIAADPWPRDCSIEQPGLRGGRPLGVA